MSEKETAIKLEETPQEQEVEVMEHDPLAGVDLNHFPWTDEEKVNYKYADMYVWCRKCNLDNGPEAENVQTALIVQAPTDNRSYIGLTCRNCGNQLVLHFRDAANPPTPEEEAEMERQRLEERDKRIAEAEAKAAEELPKEKPEEEK